MRIGIVCLATILSTLAGSAFAAEVASTGASAKAGYTVFKKCVACHTATEPVAKIGPSLMGVVGRKVGSFAGYTYSPALLAFGAGGKVWDEATLAAYLAHPKDVIPKGKMSFAGLKKSKEVADVIAYLKNPAAGTP